LPTNESSQLVRVHAIGVNKDREWCIAAGFIPTDRTRHGLQIIYFVYTLQNQ
jgi:hypothetical protein